MSKAEHIFWATFLAKAGVPLLVLALIPVELFLRRFWKYYIDPLLDPMWEWLYRAYWRRKGFTVGSEAAMPSRARPARR